MRRRVESNEAEDATLLAGWMYADLLLGLMVMDKAFNFNRGISLIYDKFDAVALEKDIDSFKKREGLDNDAEIIFAQILGGYDPKTESVDDGRNRALLYSFNLSEEQTGLFRSASVTAGADPGLKPGEIALRLTFVSKIKK